MMTRLEELPAATLAAIQLASCIGGADAPFAPRVDLTFH